MNYEDESPAVQALMHVLNVDWRIRAGTGWLVAVVLGGGICAIGWAVVAGLGVAVLRELVVKPLLLLREPDSERPRSAPQPLRVDLRDHRQPRRADLPPPGERHDHEDDPARQLDEDPPADL